MYRTYNSNEQKKEPVFEEKLTPKVVEEKEIKICDSGGESTINTSSNPFSALLKNSSVGTDDLLIIALVVLLLSEKCEDNMIIVILIALLFLK